MTAAPPKPPAPASFDELFESELSYVWNVLRRLGIAEADREDLAQEVFVRVHKSLSTYDPSRPRRPWLFAFVFRIASDHRRLKRHKVEVAATSDDHQRAASDAAPADETLDAARRRHLLHRALDTLDLDKRAVVVLHEMEGMTIPDVAETLGIPVGTASSRLRAARSHLKEVLEKLRTVDSSVATPGSSS